MSSESGTASRTLSDAVALEIQVELLRRGWTQTDLAQRMGKSDMWVSRRLRVRGQRQTIDLDDLARFADALSMSATRLIEQATSARSMSTKTALTKRRRRRTRRAISAIAAPPNGKDLRTNGPSTRTDQNRPAEHARRLHRLPS